MIFASASRDRTKQLERPLATARRPRELSDEGQQGNCDVLIFATRHSAAYGLVERAAHISMGLALYRSRLRSSAVLGRNRLIALNLHIVVIISPLVARAV